MSRENVEIVKRAIEAFSAGDADAFAEHTTPEVEWATGLGAVEGEIFPGARGRGNVLRQAEQRMG